MNQDLGEGIWESDHGGSLHEAQAQDEVIDQQDPIAEGQPMQATLRQRKLLVGRQAAYAHPREADLQLEKQRDTVGECHGQQGIRLPPPVLQMQQGQEGIQEGAPIDEKNEPHATPCETINIGMASLACPPKAFSPARQS